MLALEGIRDLEKKIMCSKELSPSIERWLDSTKELELELSNKVLFLSRYIDQIPEDVLPSYSKVLVNVLNDVEMNGYLSFSRSLIEGFSKLVEMLEQSGKRKEASDVRIALQGLSGVSESSSK